jgi:flagellar basal-body rod modification protein FlgD
MTSPISGSSGTPATNPVSATSPTEKKDASKDFGDKDTFLKLLVAQLKYQDPSNPADPTQFMSQTAQFTQVEKLGDIADLMKSQRLVNASALVGHTVNYMDETGAKLTGTISSAKLNGDSEPMLHIGNTDVLLSKVMEVLPNGAEPGSATGSPAPVASGAAAAPAAPAKPPVLPAATPTAPPAAAPAASAASAAPAPAAPAESGEPADSTAPTTGPATA